MSIMSLFLLLCFTGNDIAVAANAQQSLRHEYYAITTPVTWGNAQIYCRSKYVDLATVQTNDDWQRLNTEAANKGLTTNGWIGLYLDVKDWYWSYKTQVMNFSLMYWGSGQPDNAGGREACAGIDANGYWNDYPCTDMKPFICYHATSGGFVGFSAATMSWWGGQTYCRTHYTDLASATTATENSQLKQIASVQGISWFGLFRDTWMWSDGSIPMALQWSPGLPNNTDHNDNCAAVNNSTILDKQCNSLFSFFCHTPYKVRYQVVKLQFQGDDSVFDPAIQSAILQQIVEKLKQNGLSRETTVTWNVQPDGSIFQKKRKIGGL